MELSTIKPLQDGTSTIPKTKILHMGAHTRALINLKQTEMETDHNLIFSIKLSKSTFKTYMLDDTDMHF
jgi:hypothetical protein